MNSTPAAAGVYTAPAAGQEDVMLVLSREREQSLIFTVGDKLVQVEVYELRGDKARLAIVAPSDVRIDREEIWRERNPGAKTPLELEQEAKAAAIIAGTQT